MDYLKKEKTFCPAPSTIFDTEEIDAVACPRLLREVGNTEWEAPFAKFCIVNTF